MHSRRVFSFLLAALCMFFLHISSALALAETSPLEIYLIDPCGACQGAAVPGCGECRLEDEAYLRYRQLLADVGQPQRSIRIHNLRRNPELYGNLEQFVRGLGFEGFRLPILIVGDVAFPANGDADVLLKEYLLTGVMPEDINLDSQPTFENATTTEPVKRNVIYLYSKYCEDCQETLPLLKQVIPHDVQLLSFDIATREGSMVELAVEDYFGIVQADFIVPAVICGEELLLGTKSIREGIEALLEQPINTPLDALLDFAGEGT